MPSIFLWRHHSYWIRDHLNLVWPHLHLITFAKSLSPDKVIFTRSWGLGCQNIFWGDTVKLTSTSHCLQIKVSLVWHWEPHWTLCTCFISIWRDLLRVPVLTTSNVSSILTSAGLLPLSQCCTFYMIFSMKLSHWIEIISCLPHRLWAGQKLCLNQCTSWASWQCLARCRSSTINILDLWMNFINRSQNILF